MFGERVSTEKKLKYPTLRLEKDSFSFIKSLKVGNKGVIDFSGVIKSHRKDNDPDSSDEENESKTIRFTNIKLLSKNVRAE